MDDEVSTGITLDFDEEDGVYRTRHDFSGSTRLSTTVVLALEEIAQVGEARVTPLYATVDPDGLDALFRPTTGGDRSDGHVSFEVLDHDVTVFADGRIQLRPLDDD